MQRDFIKEIENAKENKERFRVRQKLSTLNNLLISENVTGELTHFFPISLIACLESYFRATIKDVIDYGSPYIDNCSKLKDLKFDVNTIKAIHNKRITIGDFISHLLKISSLEQIDLHMTTILGRKFLESLPLEKRGIYTEGKLKQSSNPMSRKSDSVYKKIVKLFELRHQIAHEVSLNTELSSKTIKQYFNAVEIFIDATEILIANIYYPEGVPQCTYDWREYNGKHYNLLTGQLEDTVKEIETILKKRVGYRTALERKYELEEFKALQESWKNYQGVHAGFMANINARGGSAWPLYYMDTASELVEDMLVKYKVILNILKD